MTNQDWQTLEDLKNDYTELRCGNTTHRSDKELDQNFIQNQMRVHAHYSGHLNWQVLRTWM